MQNWQMKTPVVFLVFNRVDTTEKVFEAIRCARPPKLLVVADGPRLDKPGEGALCEATRAIMERVDWPCEVLTNYSDLNLGCRARISSGLDWVFSQVDEAIILEDDCLPSRSFFRFCEEMLEKYRFDERIGIISGDNFLFGRIKPENSYYFSRNTHIWGWASWKRVWASYDVNMALYPEIRDSNLLLNTLSDNKNVIKYWKTVFELTYNGDIDTWDYQLAFANLIQNRLCIMPQINLISNIGFGADATRTKIITQLSNIDAEEMAFPLKHPKYVIRDISADSLTENANFTWDMSLRLYWEKVKTFLKRRLKEV